jgi:hypothetical protein
LPNLITDLHAHVASDPAHRGEALAGLLDAYTAATFIAKHLGAPDLATVAAMHARAVARSNSNRQPTPPWPSCSARTPYPAQLGRAA